MAMEWGLCPLPTQDDCPLTAHSLLPPSPALGRLTEPPLRGAHSPSLTGLLSHSPVSGVIQKACYSEEDSVSRHQHRFPGSHSPLLVLSQLRPQKPPRAPSPMALPGRSLPSGLVLLSHIPCRVARSSHCPGQAVCSVLGRPPWCQMKETTDTCAPQPPPRSTVASSCLLTSSLWMGPGWAQGPHCVSWFSSHPSAAHGGVARLLCACCTERVLVHTPLPGAQGSGGQAPPRVWGSPGQVPRRAQQPGTRTGLQSAPSPPVGQV